MSKEKKRFIKWIIYWLPVLGFYITISLVFGNFIMYTPVLAFAMANFLIRLVAELSFGKIRHEVLPAWNFRRSMTNNMKDIMGKRDITTQKIL